MGHRFMPVLWHKLNLRLMGRVNPNWVRDFLVEWHEKKSRSMNSSHFNTSVENWYCSCVDFLLSRFNLCMHLCQADSVIYANIDLAQVSRNDSYPFLRIPMILQNGHLNSSFPIGEPMAPLNNYLAHIADREAEREEPSGLDDDNEIITRHIEDLMVYQQENRHDGRAMRKLRDSLKRSLRVVEEYKAHQRRRLMPTTTSLH